MTLVTAWVREIGSTQELVIASDSRVTGGILVNHCPKLFPLVRNDAVLAYCGNTAVAYPIILQIKAALDAYGETRDRIKDITDLPAHIEKTIEYLREEIADLPCNDGTNLDFKFLLAGYSWKYNVFRAWIFRYDLLSKSFNAFSMSKEKYQFMFMSDLIENEHSAKNSLLRILNIKKPASSRLNWEPLDVLISTIRDESINDIGGPPQLIKIYKHANTLPINVLWPTQLSSDRLAVRHQITQFGRPLLAYEQTQFLTLDLKSGDFVEPWNIRERARMRDEETQQQALKDHKHNLLVRLMRAITRREKSLAAGEAVQKILNAGGSFESIQKILAECY